MREGWEVKTLGEVCDIDKVKYSASDLPFVGLEDIQSNAGPFIGDLTPRGMESSTFHFSEDHLLYGRLRPYLNKVLLPNFEGHCSSEIFPLLTSEGLDRRYLYYWLTSEPLVEKINLTCTGARMPRANVKEVMKFPIPLPPLAEQKRIVGVLDEAFAEIKAAAEGLRKNLASARELFETTLNATFSQKGEGWVTEELNENVKFIDYRGKTPPKTPEGIRLITAKNVKMGFIQRTPEEFIDEAAYEAWMTRGFPKFGDVLFTTEAPLGKVAQLDTHDIVVIGQRLITMQPAPDLLDATFLKFLLMSQMMQKEILERGTGATVLGIKAKLLKKIPIHFPKTLSEQKLIVSRLERLSTQTQALEALYQRKLDALEELKQSLLQKAFAGELTRELTANKEDAA